MASIKYEIGENCDERQLDIVIKLLPQDPFGRYFVTINQFDLREIQFYTTVCVYIFLQNGAVLPFMSPFFFFFTIHRHIDIFRLNEVSKCAFENRLRTDNDSGAKMFLF